MWWFIGGFLVGSIVTFTIILTGAMMKIQNSDDEYFDDEDEEQLENLRHWEEEKINEGRSSEDED